MAFEITRQEILKQAIAINLLWKQTREQKYKDEEIRLRRIVLELDNFIAGVTTLDGLSDVTISAPANAQVLAYNSTTNQWENQTPAAGGGGDMLKSTYDVDNDGIVDGSETTQIIVRNSTGTTLTKGTVVYLSGATGNRPNAVRAQANTEATSSKTIGIVIANITNNSDGFIAVNGTLHDLDTSAYTAGDAVWLSATTAGAFTSTIPVEPNHTVFVGYIARSHPTQGRLVILIQNGYELNELHGVLIASEANNDLLVYETTSGLWKNKTFSAIGLQPALSGTGFVKISGTTISYDNSTYYLASNPNGYTTNTGTVTSVGLSSTTTGITIGATPVTTSGTITINIATASGSQNGLLSSADWTTFNNKQNTITLTTTGTSGASTFVSNTLNIPNYTLTGLGYSVPTLAQVTAAGATTTTQMSVGTLTNSQGSFTSELILEGEGGFASTVFRFDGTGRFIVGQVDVRGTNDIFFQALPDSTSGYGFLEAWESAGMVVGTGGNSSPVIFQVNRGEKARIVSTGNLLIGTTTDAGFKLDVNGSIRTTSTINATLANVTTANVVYYNTTNGLFTYGAVGGGVPGSGTVTSVNGTGTVSGLTLSGTVTSAGDLTLGGTLAVTPSNFASQTARTFLAAPNAAAGVPTFRLIIASDIPTLNQNTTGTAARLTTARNFTIGSTTRSFNGSANVAWTLAEIGAGTVTSIAAGVGLSGGTITTSGTIALADTAVTPGAYTNADITVDQQGRIIAASNGSASGTGTVTSVGLSSTTTGITIGSTPITTSGTITINIATATGSQNGLLSSTDWTTFNNKQNALTNPVTGTGVAGQVAFWNGTNTQTGSNGLLWDNTNARLGVGTTSPSFKLDVNSGTSAAALRVLSTNTTSLRTFFEATAGNVEQHFLYSANQDWVLGLDKADSNKFKLASADDAFASAKLTVTTGGNVLIGTTTDAGYKLDVNGNLRASGTIVDIGGDSSEWNQAYLWGDHAAAGYITGTTGFSGIFTVPTNPPGMQNLDIQGGLVVNVF